MNNITTLETSKALIAAGFPVRRPEVGQFWYDISGEWYLVYAVDENTVSVIDNSGARWEERTWENENMISAFTAVDILRELGTFFFVQVSQSGDLWGCCEIKVSQSGYINLCGKSANPAEAAAQAFLAKNKQ